LSRPRQDGPTTSITATQHGTRPDDIAAADRRRQRIKLLLETMIQNRGKILDLITEASENHDHIALGFKSWAQYVSTEYAGLLARLTVEDRRESVLVLSRTGLSTRAIAPIVGTNHSTIVRDLRSGGADAPPDLEERLGEDDLEDRLGEDRDLDARLDNALAEISKITMPTPSKITSTMPTNNVVGIDGKKYPAPAPKPKPRRTSFPDAYRDAVWELRRAVVKLDRLTEDDRFATNQPAIAARNRGDLARISEMLSKVLDAVGGVR